MQPGVFSTVEPELGLTLSPDGRTAYISRLAADREQPTIYESRWGADGWSVPQPVFNDGALAVNPSISADGRRMVFTRSEPYTDRYHVAVAVRDVAGWGTPQPVAAATSATGSYSPTWAPDGTLYFAISRPELWDLELQRAKPQGDGYGTAESLGGQINSRYDESHPTLSPDGTMLVFSGTGQPGGRGEGDLYVCVRRDGEWSRPRPLSALVNTPAHEGSPRFSPDQKRLFFCRNGDIYEIATSVMLTTAETRRVWQPRQSLPGGRVWPRCLAIGGRLFVIGGLSGWGEGMGPLQSMLEYELSTDTWRERAAPLQGDVLAPAVVVDGRIVLFQRTAGAVGFEYDPTADRWTKRTGPSPIFLPSPHNSAAVVGDRIFVVRSIWAAPQWVGDLLEYEHTQSRWVGRGATLLSPPGEIVAGANCLYLVGGGTDVNRAAAYEPNTGTWTTLPDMGAGRVEVRCAVWNGRLVAVGGHTSRDGSTVDTVELYDPALRAWERLPSLPEPRWGAGVVVCDGRLFVIGGSPDAVATGPAATTVWEYTPETS